MSATPAIAKQEVITTFRPPSGPSGGGGTGDLLLLGLVALGAYEVVTHEQALSAVLQPSRSTQASRPTAAATTASATPAKGVSVSVPTATVRAATAPQLAAPISVPLPAATVAPTVTSAAMPTAAQVQAVAASKGFTLTPEQVAYYQSTPAAYTALQMALSTQQQAQLAATHQTTLTPEQVAYYTVTPVVRLSASQAKGLNAAQRALIQSGAIQKADGLTTSQAIAVVLGQAKVVGQGQIQPVSASSATQTTAQYSRQLTQQIQQQNQQFQQTLASQSAQQFRAGAVQGLQVVSVTPYTATVAWQPYPGAVNYSVGGTGIAAVETNGATQATVTGLLPNHSYQVTVYAASVYGQSIPATVAVRTAPPPAAPLGKVVGVSINGAPQSPVPYATIPNYWGPGTSSGGSGFGTVYTAYRQQNVSVTIRNTGGQAAAFTVTGQALRSAGGSIAQGAGAPIATVSAQTGVLQPGQSQTVQLAYTPVNGWPQGAPIDPFAITLSVTGQGQTAQSTAYLTVDPYAWTQGY
jgi:hypothetical protein